MSTNAYESEQIISYGTAPVHYFGFCLSTSGSSLEAHPFNSAADRGRWLSEIGAALPASFDDYQKRIAAVLLMFDAWGDEEQQASASFMLDERDNNGGRYLFDDLSDEQLEAAREVAYKVREEVA
jgi:hypothetical protein